MFHVEPTLLRQIKPGLIIFRRGDLGHENYYCRIRIQNQDLCDAVPFQGRIVMQAYTPKPNETKTPTARAIAKKAGGL